jgi:hypothetical protein
MTGKTGTAGPCRYVVRHMAGARCESGRDNHQCNQTSHDGIRKKAGGGSEAFLILPAKQAKIDGL